jgi:diaminopimelate epimerase
MKLQFWKMSGAGNDFVLLAKAPRGSLSKLAARLCDRRRGVGADGLLLVSGGRLRYWNADGSAAFCGNGTRCAALWLHARTGKRAFALKTGQGTLAARVLGKERAAIEMPPPGSWGLPRKVAALGKTYEVVTIDTGVPHAVVFVKNVSDFPVAAVGRALRFHKAFKPAGANVDFVQIKGRSLMVRTYERGVEDETLACGTGVVASVLAAALRFGARSPVRVLARGGDALSVSFKRAGPGFSDVWLEGPGTVVYKGEASI